MLKVISLIPGIIELIKTAEQVLPIPDSGDQKLEFVISLLQVVAGDISPDMLKGIITVVVKLFNKFGIFKSTPKTAAA